MRQPRRALLATAAIALLATLAACGRRAPLRPGTGGLRVRSSHTAPGAVVSLQPSSSPSTRATTRAMTDGEVVVGDLAPGTYDVAVTATDGRGGYYSTLGGNPARVEEGSIEDVWVSLDTGVFVAGHVFDADTHAPLAGVDVRPPRRVASSTWPVALPSLWAAGRDDGSFAIGGVSVPAGEARELIFTREGYRTRHIPISEGATRLQWEVALERDGAVRDDAAASPPLPAP